MSAHEQQNPPKRPRLSLQIKAISSGPNLRASRTIAAAVNPTSPTSFNTLSNVYATAIDRATPVTAINTNQPLKLQTQDLGQNQHGTQTPYASTLFPETPLTAQPISPAIASLQDFRFPSTMTATPPLSAGAVDNNEAKSFSFSAADTADASTPSVSAAKSTNVPNFSTTPTSTMRRRATVPLNVISNAAPPYARNRSLHSILRNSPLPPPTAKTPTSPRRQSLRLAEKAARRVGYESPIERVITTEQYVRSHVDLLLAEESQLSPSSVSPTSTLDDIMMAANESSETRDGGQTPGPFEEMRRRMAGLVTRTPTTSSPSCTSSGSSPVGIRKRRRKDRGRRWVWTIGNQDEDDEEDDAEVGGAIAATRAAASRAQRAASYPNDSTQSATTTTPITAPPLPPIQVEMAMPSPMEILTPSIETFDEAESSTTVNSTIADDDIVMSESEAETEPDAETTTARGNHHAAGRLHGKPMIMMDMDTMITPTVAKRPERHNLNFLDPARRSRSVMQDSDGLFNSETGSRRDTPIPAELVPTAQ